MVRPVSALLLCLALAACATRPPPPPAPPFLAFELYGANPEPLPTPENDVAAIKARAAAKGYTLDEENLQSNLIQLFATRARRANLPGFYEVWIDWRSQDKWVDVGTSVPPDRDAYLTMAAPELRSYVRFRRTMFDKAGSETFNRRLIEAYGENLGVCIMSYDYQSDWYSVGIEDYADEAAIRAATPADMLPFIRFERGQCPILI